MSKLTVLSLFTGAGGLDYGFEAAGYEVTTAVELDHDSCETFRSHSSASIIERSIFDVPTGEILSEAGLRPGDADVLIAGPPCQPFSKAGYWAKGDAQRLKDPRARTLDAFLRVLEEAQPRTVLLENVAGIDYSGKNEGLRLLLDQIDNINARLGTSYRPFTDTLNAADFGVPQFRSRFFLVASREGDAFKFPKATHGEAKDGQTLLGLQKYRTAWDAIGDLTRDPDEDLAVRGKWADLLPTIPEGHNYLWHTARGGGLPLFGWRRRFWSFLLKLSKRAPSWTVQAQPGPATGPFHWTSRRLSMRELCRLQTFPDHVSICGGRTSIQKQVGNAVPSLLAEVLARAIRQQLLGRKLSSPQPHLLPPVRFPIPPAEPVAEVPAAFRHLVGDHEAHPGTGKGFAAQRRVAVGG